MLIQLMLYAREVMGNKISILVFSVAEYRPKSLGLAQDEVNLCLSKRVGVTELRAVVVGDDAVCDFYDTGDW
ncbi:hypothetical protein OF385_13810 [Glutamicibacter sp. JL.03c]|uniref:hypothetical protein n=1 Tax=Glutamicibacter sp. JL.03c TaxID=2984842 RepID=UPI0021F7CB80|nr:hypothetical protein [Glutamicibacter sp. JL.03c]UYQ77081.1 hypothetical protein OF385_13810 [Glutamicibacter sp. JL.03c]